MTTVADVRDHIKADLIINGSDYDAQIVNAIYSALRQYRGKRFWFLKTTDVLVTLAAGDNSVALPPDFSAPCEFELFAQGVRRSDGKGFDYLTFERLKREYWLTDPLQTDIPKACAVVGSTLYVNCLSSGTYSINCTYYRQDQSLPAVTGTSLWFDDGYDAIRSLAQYIFKRDSQGMTLTEADSDMVRDTLIRLEETHQSREAGR